MSLRILAVLLLGAAAIAHAEPAATQPSTQPTTQPSTQPAAAAATLEARLNQIKQRVAQARQQVAEAPATQPATQPSTQPTATAQNFPTPAELIERMKQRKADEDARSKVAYFDLGEPLL